MTAHAQCAGEGGGRGHIGGIFLARVCARNYSGAKFIAPSRGPILSPSPSPSHAGDWEVILRGSCVSTSSRALLWSGRWHNHIHVKWVPQFFPACVDSNLRVQLDPPSRSCHPMRGEKEKNVSVTCCSAYHACPYFPSTKAPLVYPLDHTFKYPCQHLKSDYDDGISLAFP